MTTNPRCTATSRTGKPCRQPAIPGGVVCRYHGGSAPQVVRTAAERVAQKRAQKVLADLGTVEPVADPMLELEKIAGRAVTLVEVLGGIVSQLTEVAYKGGIGQGVEQVRGEVQAYQSALARAESVLSKILALDLDARRVRLQEAQAAVVLGAFAAVLADPGLALSVEQQRTARQLLASRLVSSPLAGHSKPTVDQGQQSSLLIGSQEMESDNGD